MRLTYIYLQLVFLFTVVSATAQRAQLITTGDHLSSSKVNHVARDKDGYIWMSTEYGLDRYDAARMRHYRTVKDDTTSLSNNFVRSTYMTSKDRIYVLTLDGLNLYNMRENNFIRIPFYNKKGERENTTYISQVLETHSHGVLVSSAGWGLYKLSDDGQRADAAFDQIPSRYINAMLEDKQQRLWISTEGHGLFCIQSNGKMTRYDTNPFSMSNITHMVQDKNGVIYLGTQGSGVWRFVEQQKTFEKIGGNISGNEVIRSLYCDTDRLLIGTDGNGLKQLTYGSSEIDNVYDLWLPIDMERCKPTSIMRDKNGVLWVAFYQHGVGLFPRTERPFRYYGFLEHVTDFIGNSTAMAVARDNAGKIWVGTENDALYCIGADGTSHSRIESSSGITLNHIHSMHLDHTGTLWIGTYGSGLLKLDTATGHIERYGKTKDGNTWTPTEFISTIQDDGNGNLWIGTNGNGLFCMDLATGVVVPATEKGDEGLGKNGEPLSNRWVTSLAIGNDGNLWIGTYYGLNYLNLKTHNIKYYDSLRTTAITSLAIGNDKSMWVGTYHGVWKIKDGNEKLFSLDCGLPNEVIQSMVVDHEGNVWMGTNDGFAVLQKDKERPLTFTGRRGIRISEFSAGAATVGNNGEVILGGVTGVIIGSPDKLKEVDVKPTLHISGIMHDNEYINFASKSGWYTIIEEEDDSRTNHTYHFAHDDASFTICLTAQSYLFPDGITYVYSINDDEWQQLPEGESNLQFSNLQPGRYNIRIKCLNRNIESDVREFNVVVHSAWYASWFAKFIYLLLIVILGVYIFMSYRRNMLSAERERNQQRQLKASESKLKFLIDLSHEIRTPMSMIISPTETLIRKDGDNTSRRHYYDIILNGSKRIMSLVNQMLDMSKIESGQLRLTFRPTDINAYVENICSFMDAAAEQKGLTLSYNSVLTDTKVYIDNDYFDKTIINLIGNSTKFTDEGGRISVSLSDGKINDKPAVVIAVTDNGCGVPEEAKKHLFERFYQADNSIADGNLGTGIGLNLTFALVKMHGGTIDVTDNPEGSGTVFIIRIPRGTEHISPEQIGPAKEMSEEEVFVNPAELEESETENTDANIPTMNGIAGTPHILVVDDDLDIRNFLSGELSEGYVVTTAVNGSEAWQMMLKEKPDLVITDIMMPVMDGIELCRKIRQNINVNSVPVIMLTAANAEDYQLRGLDTGADSYINKPFSMPVLLSTIKNVLRSRQMLRNCYEGRQDSNVDISNLEDAPNHDEILLKRIIKVVEENLSNHDLNVEMLAREAALSRVHLYRKLKELTNQSPSDFIRQIRLKKAGELLRKGNYNISEVAELMGFSSLAVFSRAFKDFYGVTPKEFITNNKAS